MVTITLRVLSRPDVDQLPKIYQGLGLDYDERVLPSIGNEVLKAIVAQFDAAELITQREVVRLVHPRLYSAVLMQVVGVLKDTSRAPRSRGRIQYHPRGCIHYPPYVRQGARWRSCPARAESKSSLGIHASRRGEANSTARFAILPHMRRRVALTLIRRRRAREVHRREGKRRVASWIPHAANDSQAEQERQAAVIRAEGESEAAATISAALQKAGEAFIAFRKIEASKAIVQSLTSNPNVTYVPSSGGNLLLNVPTK